MKNYFLKTIFSLFVSGFILAVNAQDAAKTATPAAASASPTERQMKKTADLVNKVISVVQLTPEQKQQLQTSMLENVIKFDQAWQTARGDDDKIAQWRKDREADLKDRLKTLLTPEQFTQVMNKGFK